MQQEVEVTPSSSPQAMDFEDYEGVRFFECNVCLEPLHQEHVVVPWVVDRENRTRQRACRHIFHERCMCQLEALDAYRNEHRACIVCRVPFKFSIPVPRPFSSPWGWAGVVAQEAGSTAEGMPWEQVAKTVSMCVRVDPEKIHTFFETLVNNNRLPRLLGKAAHIQAIRLVCHELDNLSPDSPPGGCVGEKTPDFFDQIEEWFMYWTEPAPQENGKRFVRFPSGLAVALAYTWSDRDHRREKRTPPTFAHGDLHLSEEDWVNWLLALVGPGAKEANTKGSVSYVLWQSALGVEIVDRLQADFPQLHYLHKRRYRTYPVSEHADGVEEQQRLLHEALADVQTHRAYAMAHLTNFIANSPIRPQAALGQPENEGEGLADEQAWWNSRATCLVASASTAAAAAFTLSLTAMTGIPDWGLALPQLPFTVPLAMSAEASAAGAAVKVASMCVLPSMLMVPEIAPEKQGKAQENPDASNSDHQESSLFSVGLSDHFNQFVVGTLGACGGRVGRSNSEINETIPERG